MSGPAEPAGLPQQPRRGATGVSNPAPRSGDSPGGREIIFTKASAVRPEPIRWLWKGRVPLGALTVLAGVQGLGKSTFTAWMTARVTRGNLDGDLNGGPAAALVNTKGKFCALQHSPRFQCLSHFLRMLSRRT